MADRYRRRKPLAELPTSTNTPPRHPVSRAKKTLSPSVAATLPHNVSLEANGSLNTRSQPNSPEQKRISKLVDGDEWKRNSAISTVSTNASNGKRKVYIGHWQLGKTIGRGGCSRVRAVRHRYTQQQGAVKIIARSTAESTRAQSLANLIESSKGSANMSATGYRPIPYGLEREIALMKLLDHVNIVKLYDVWENRNELYLIMEYVKGGELFHYVEKRRGLAEDETVIIFRQIVSALLYCHRLQICHRDLKPENILLDLEQLQVKLIDFGMAALQPEGKLLSTPCGSPHYAAPEVVSAKPYDGRSADAWSCGVILYVMLTGTTPFNYRHENDLRGLFADISRANYSMPPGLSHEARDLIMRIFVPDPQRRITMDEIWEHPLLHKYDVALGLVGPYGTKESAIGPVPRLEDWTISRSQDIDLEILRNMRTLWHSEPESSLMQKLLNKEVNQEKIFYAALLKHQDENLENFSGEYEGMPYSASDYHHTQPTRALGGPPRPLNSEQRSQSQYSIMNDEHLRPSHSFVEPAPSISSYDPYRSSRQPIIERDGNGNTIIHRRSGNNVSARTSLRNSRLGRPNTVKHRSGYSRSSSSLPRSPQGRASLRRSSMSKNSLSSSPWPSSPPVVVVKGPGSLHKRAVAFNHLRRTSTPSALAAQASAKATSGSRTASQATSSPTMPAPTLRITRDDEPPKSQIKARKPCTPGQAIRSDIRKHSMELEKACEQAFFRSSAGSDMTSSPLTERTAPSETPPSSISMRDSTTSETKIQPRPLPDPPSDTPTTYLARTLKEFRARLTAYKGHDQAATADFDEVLRMFDDMLPARTTNGKRLLSVPGTMDQSSALLPSISEESNDTKPVKHRSVTAPTTASRGVESTIKIIPATPPSGIAPLNIRKRGQDFLVTDDKNAGPIRRQRSHDTTDMLEAIHEDQVLATIPALAHKRSGWFGMTKRIRTSSQDAVKRHPKHEAVDEGMQDTTLSTDSSEFPLRRREIKPKKNIARWIGKHITKERAVHDDEPSNTGLPNESTDSLFSTMSSPSPSVNRPAINNDRGRSWFARFLNIRPTVRLLCFSIPRNRARQELVLLFEEWQRHGIRDLHYSRETQTITARVDRQNSLDIKPVSFRVECFVVLEHGRKVGLSIARFTQTKGAASGFKKVLEVVDGAMRSRSWLVEDEEKRQALCDIIEKQ